MKQSSIKSLLLSSVLLCSLQLSAQENAKPDDELEYEEPETCLRFPSCAGISGESSIEEREEQSEWSKFWQEIAKEFEEKVGNEPRPIDNQ